MSYKKKILFSGGGTGGSVTPLLAIVDVFRSAQPEMPIEFFWIGTRNGIEKTMVEDAEIKFASIPAGKFRRYFSWRNFIDPFFIPAGFIKALYLILRWKPDVIISAGSFVAVPVVWAGWLCRVPIVIHQQDVVPGLANKLCAPFARAITVTFEKSTADFGKKSIWTGNPTRHQFAYHNPEIRVGHIRNFPILLVLGGGTGSSAINQTVFKTMPKLVKFCRVIHLTGPSKAASITDPNYEQHEFLATADMAKVYAAADMVVTRAGMAVLTEISFLGKPAIIIPLPDSHQEANAAVFHDAKAAIILKQAELSPEVFVKVISRALADEKLLVELAFNIGRVIKKDAGKNIEMEIRKILSK